MRSFSLAALPFAHHGTGTLENSALGLEEIAHLGDVLDSCCSPPSCRMSRTQSRLKQSPQLWNKELNRVLVEELGFSRASADACL